MLVLLQKQGDRYILRCQEGQVNQASETAGNVHDPFISMQRAHVSTVATGEKTILIKKMNGSDAFNVLKGLSDNSCYFSDKRAFFVVSYVSAQMYEFVATSTSQMKEWMSIIAKTAKSEVFSRLSLKLLFHFCLPILFFRTHLKLSFYHQRFLDCLSPQLIATFLMHCA